MKDMIVECMAFFGWRKDRIVDCFSKTYETALTPSKASIWLTFDVRPAACPYLPVVG